MVFLNTKLFGLLSTIIDFSQTVWVIRLNSCNDEWKKILTWMLCFTFISHCETINELVCHEITNIRATSLLISIDTPGYNNYNQK